MNREFIKKMIKAEALRYEAIMEVLPPAVSKRVKQFQGEAESILKEIALELIEEKSGPNDKKEIKKVKVDF